MPDNSACYHLKTDNGMAHACNLENATLQLEHTMMTLKDSAIKLLEIARPENTQSFRELEEYLENMYFA